MAKVPYAFAAQQGNVPASQIDANNQFLIDMIESLGGSDIAFNDTVGLGASTMQGAIVALYTLIQNGGGGGGGGSPSADFSQSTNSMYVPAFAA